MQVAEARTATPHLSARDLAFSAGELAILKGLNLDLFRGERLAVIGPNGSGKSTLLRCLYAWQKPTGGAVLLDGSDIYDTPAAARARQIAVLAQEGEGGLGLTVAEVAALGRLPHQRGWSGLGPHDKAVVDLALKAVQIEDLSGRVFSHLSGGEKQRALFARALAQEPALLILDEPTNHLDIRHQLELLDIARGLGVSLIATLHDINLAARWGDRLCLMQDGRIRAVGDPETVLQPDLLSEVYGVEVERDRDPRTGALRLSFYAKEVP